MTTVKAIIFDLDGTLWETEDNLSNEDTNHLFKGT